MFSYRRVRFNVGYGERHFLIHPTLRVCVGYREESETQHKSNTCFSLHQQLGLAFVKQWHKKTQQTSCDQQQDRHLLWRWSQTCPRGQGQYRSASSLRHPEFPAQTWVMSVETGRHTHRRMKETEHTLSLGKLSSSPMLSSACKKASSGPWWPVLEVSKEWNVFFLILKCQTLISIILLSVSATTSPLTPLSSHPLNYSLLQRQLTIIFMLYLPTNFHPVRITKDPQQARTGFTPDQSTPDPHSHSHLRSI